MLVGEILRSQWLSAAKHLGLRVGGPISIPLPSGDSYEFSVLVSDFGTPLGTLIHSEHHREAFKAAIEAGYATSIYTPSASEDVDAVLYSYVECLNDWGWCGQGDPPAWYKSESEGSC